MGLINVCTTLLHMMPNSIRTMVLCCLAGCEVGNRGYQATIANSNIGLSNAPGVIVGIDRLSSQGLGSASISKQAAITQKQRHFVRVRRPSGAPPSDAIVVTYEYVDGRDLSGNLESHGDSGRFLLPGRMAALMLGVSSKWLWLDPRRVDSAELQSDIILYPYECGRLLVEVDEVQEHGAQYTVSVKSIHGHIPLAVSVSQVVAGGGVIEFGPLIPGAYYVQFEENGGPVTVQTAIIKPNTYTEVSLNSPSLLIEVAAPLFLNGRQMFGSAITLTGLLERNMTGGRQKTDVAGEGDILEISAPGPYLCEIANPSLSGRCAIRVDVSADAKQSTPVAISTFAIRGAVAVEEKVDALMVYLEPTDATLSGPYYCRDIHIAAITSDDGRQWNFVVPAVPLGEYKISATGYKGGRPSLHTMPLVVRGEVPLEQVQCTLPSTAYGQIVGIILDEYEKPVRWANLDMMTTNSSRDVWFHSATTNELGEFHFRGLPRVPMVLQLRDHGLAILSSPMVVPDLADGPPLVFGAKRARSFLALALSSDGEAGQFMVLDIMRNGHSYLTSVNRRTYRWQHDLGPLLDGDYVIKWMESSGQINESALSVNGQEWSSLIMLES